MLLKHYSMSCTTLDLMTRIFDSGGQKLTKKLILIV